MPIPPQVIKCYKYIDNEKSNYVDELKSIVAIAGISGKSEPKFQKQLSLLIEWLEDRLKGLGFSVELREMGSYTPKGSDTPVYR